MFTMLYSKQLIIVFWLCSMDFSLEELKIIDDSLLWVQEEFKEVFWPYFEGSEKQKQIILLQDKVEKILRSANCPGYVDNLTFELHLVK